MFGLTTATRVFAATGATDMRIGFDGLFGLVRDVLGEDPLSGHLFLFANRDRTRIKILVWDGSGLWVCAKRLAVRSSDFLSDKSVMPEGWEVGTIVQQVVAQFLGIPIVRLTSVESSGKLQLVR